MKEILMTYNMLNFDLGNFKQNFYFSYFEEFYSLNKKFSNKGYVQGMSDLLAPIMVIMENEVDSFWCFAGFMDKIVVYSI